MGKPQTVKQWLEAVHWGLRHWRQAQALQSRPSQDAAHTSIRPEELLDSPLWQLRNIGVKLIGNWALLDLLPELYRCLSDRKEAPIIRRNAAQALASFPPQASPNSSHLLNALGDPYWEVRTEALLTLAKTQSPSDGLTTELIARLTGTQPPHTEEIIPVRERVFEVRAAYACAFGHLAVSELALAPFKALIHDRHWLVRAQTAAALAHFAHRCPQFREPCRGLLSKCDLLSDAAVPTFHLKQTVKKAASAMKPGTTQTASEFAPIYIDLKRGWYA